jgi:hypothetical protein
VDFFGCHISVFPRFKFGSWALGLGSLGKFAQQKLKIPRLLIWRVSWKVAPPVVFRYVYICICILYFEYIRKGGPIARKIFLDCCKFRSGKGLGRKILVPAERVLDSMRRNAGVNA